MLYAIRELEKERRKEIIFWHQCNSIQFYLLSACNNGHYNKAALLESRCVEIQRVVKKKPLRQHEKESLRGTRLKVEPILFWVTPDNEIMNHYSSTTTVCVIKSSSMEWWKDIEYKHQDLLWFQESFSLQSREKWVTLEHKVLSVSVIFKLSKWEHSL